MDLLIDLLTVEEPEDRKIAAQLLGLRLEVSRPLVISFLSATSLAA